MNAATDRACVIFWRHLYLILNGGRDIFVWLSAIKMGRCLSSHVQDLGLVLLWGWGRVIQKCDKVPVPVVPSHFYSSEAQTGIQTHVPPVPGTTPPSQLGNKLLMRPLKLPLKLLHAPNKVCVCVCVWACVLDRETERGSHTCSLSPWNWVNSEPVNPAVASKMSLSPGASNREPPHWFVQVCVSVSRGRIEGVEVTVVRAQDRQSQTRHLNCAESILRNWVLGTQLPPSLISEDELLDMSHCSLNGIRSKGKRKKKKNRWQHTLWILQPAPPPTSLGKPWAFKAVSFFFSFFFFSFFVLSLFQ